MFQLSILELVLVSDSCSATGGGGCNIDCGISCTAGGGQGVGHGLICDEIEGS